MFSVNIILFLGFSLNLFLLTDCNSAINELTVSRSVLYEIFFNEVKNNRELINVIPNSAEHNTTKCLLGLQEIAEQFPGMKVFPFVDAWGSIPSGLLLLNLASIGNYDQCIRISTKLSDEVGVVNGQHCFLTIPLSQLTSLQSRAFSFKTPRDGGPNLFNLNIGLCVPDTCSSKLLTTIFQSAADNAFNGTISGLTVRNCQVSKKSDFKALDIFAITIFSMVGTLMFASTAYEITMKYLNGTTIPLLMAFSVITNMRKLFAINTSTPKRSIDCLAGIRVLSMFWVMYCHVFTFGAWVPLVNTIDILEWSKTAWSMHIINATVCVDTFLCISGLLVAWIGFAELDSRKGKLNVMKMYLHRYLRLTPPLAGLILYIVTVDKFIGMGPFRKIYVNLNKNCRTTWWSTMLYIQNYVHPTNICAIQTWYLAVDFQLYVLSPLALLSMRKWSKYCSPVLVILGLLSIGCTLAMYFTEGFRDLIGVTAGESHRLIYVPTHTRYSVWLVGFGLGYFMYTFRHKTFTISKPMQLLGWMMSFTIIAAVIFGPLETIRAGNHPTLIESAMYGSLKRLSWSLALSWIIFACHFGFGGLINSILSHPFWQPFQRISFSLYLVHVFVIGIYFGTMRTHNFFSDFQQITHFWAVFGMSINAAIIFTLAFESPVLALEKVFMVPRTCKSDSESILAKSSKDVIESTNGAYKRRVF